MEKYTSRVCKSCGLESVKYNILKVPELKNMYIPIINHLFVFWDCRKIMSKNLEIESLILIIGIFYLIQILFIFKSSYKLRAFSCLLSLYPNSEINFQNPFC